MKCPYCGTKCVVYRQINANGAKVVVERCPDCRRNPNAKKPFLKVSDYDWESLPLFEDASEYSEPCSVRGCTNVGTELHHFAPVHLFDDAWNWPMEYLCKEHHKEWHEKTLTGSFVTRRK